MVILIVLCAAANVYLLCSPSAKVMPKVGTVLNLLALICATVYFMDGYKKQSQFFYKGFFAFYAIHLLTGTYGMVMDFEPSVMSAAWILLFEVTFANLLMLFIPANLGGKKSEVLAILNMCLWIGFLTFDVITGKLTSPIYAIRISSYVLCSILIVVLVLAKYNDKKERGTV